mgnify:CR=1 FL=1
MDTSVAFPADHAPVSLGKVGLLLVNLGTPEAASPAAVRTYLAEFLSDRRVVDYPRALWLPILYGVILNVRPAKTARNYEKIWFAETDESPLRFYTRRQAELLAERVSADRLVIDWAMRYGNPSIPDKLAALQAKGCDRIVIFPLYPQYSATTTGTVNDRVFGCLGEMAWQPAIRTVPPFHDRPDYIQALTESVAATTAGDNPDRLILSFHGLPERYLHQGDPYHCHCQKTARLMREQAGWDETYAPLGFQSIFGREKWLEPSTENLVVKAAEEGVKHLAVITPGFVADCIETLEEVGIGLRELFAEKGGERLTLIPCLNDSTPMIDLLEGIIRQETAGWL